MVGRASIQKGDIMSTTTVSDQKRRANRRNAKQSTGPRTSEGKARSARNATSHGLYCAALVLPGESQELFHDLRQSYISTLKPQNLVELLIVDRLVAAAWKLRRLQEAEAIMHDNGLEDLLDAETERTDELMGELSYGQPAPPEITAEVEKQDLPAAAVLALKLQTSDLAFERLQRFEQRLDYTISRCLRELRKLRDDAEVNAELPTSPFLESTRGMGASPMHQRPLPPEGEERQSGGCMGEAPMPPEA